MRLTLNLGALSALNVGLTFAFQWYLLTKIGAGTETDALFASMTVPQVVLAIVSGAVVSVLVPLLAGELVEYRRREAWFFCGLMIVFFGGLSALLILLAHWWVPLMVPGFAGAALDLCIGLTRIQLVGLVFFAINAVQLAYHQADGRLAWAEFIQVAGNLAALAALVWLLPSHGVLAAAWILSGRIMLQVLLLAPGMGWPSVSSADSQTLRVAWQRIQPLLIGNAYFKTDPLIDRYLLSTASSGTMSLFYLAQQIHLAAVQVINKAIAAPIVAPLSAYHKSEDFSAFRHLCRQRLTVTWVLSVCGVLFILFFGESVLNLIFGGGSLSSADVQTLWFILLWLAGVFVGAIGGQICASIFYACGNTVTPTRMSVITFTVYVPLKIIGFLVWGLPGLAISTSLYFISNFAIQLVLLKRSGIL